MTNKEAITAGNTSLGIEFGSTRIKAVLVGPDNGVLAIGSHEWENRLENGIWTYSLDDIWNGLQDCYKKSCGGCQDTVWRDTDNNRFHWIQCNDAWLYGV